ncbi:YdcF family protein [Tomitella biformata]|uniref:YdcF family protein n=1 Tax=Tomitella biformata TaxID=630403 RepID=UPI0004637748|nr:YdcF family protein [Tomitella biformata]
MSTGLGFGGTIARWLRRGIAGALIVSAVLVCGAAFRVWQVARIDNFTPAGAVLVLGAAQYNGVPSSVFAARLDRGAELFKDGVAPLVVTVGGKQPGDVYTEAEAGKNYLVSHGVPADRVIPVSEGSDTLESIDRVADELHARGVNSVVISSDPWHSLRARTMARDAGLEAWTAPTRTGPAVYTRDSQLHGIVRETGALLWYQLTHFSADFPDVVDQ